MVNRCGSCDYLNRKDTKWGGDKIWCDYKGYYVTPGEPGCNNYTYKGHCYGRYLLTATCNILNISEETQRKLYRSFDIVRDEKTPETENMYDRVMEYDIIGPTIADKLYSDSFREVIATSMLYDYILPSLNEVSDGNYKQAFNIYKDMTETLYDFYFNNSIQRKRDINK